MLHPHLPHLHLLVLVLALAFLTINSSVFISCNRKGLGILVRIRRRGRLCKIGSKGLQPRSFQWRSVLARPQRVRGGARGTRHNGQVPETSIVHNQITFE